MRQRVRRLSRGGSSPQLLAEAVALLGAMVASRPLQDAVVDDSQRSGVDDEAQVVFGDGLKQLDLEQILGAKVGAGNQSLVCVFSRAHEN